MELLSRNYTMLTDAYELFMSGAYQNEMEGVEGVFDLFYRVAPDGGGYTIMAGLDKVIEYIKNIKFTDEDINYFIRNGYNFSEEFINYLKNFKFTGDIYAVPDGTPVFPNEPLITVKAPIMQAQIIETILLSIVNGAMGQATAARRMVEASPANAKIMEFGARRASGPEAAIDASRYAIMAGCSGTSNVLAAQILDIKALGTMAHSFVESFDDELDAFKAFAKTYPDNATLLVDTYDTLKSGVPNAIKTYDWMKKNGYPIDHIGIRIDSGDLAYLSKQARKMLDEAGYPNAKICVSNSLTAPVIVSLINQGAPIDAFGIGDNIVYPLYRIGGVYKLVAIIKDGKRIPKIKLSNDIIKIVNPDFKDVYRAYDKETGFAKADIICSRNQEMPNRMMKIINLSDLMTWTDIDNYKLVKLQKPIFKNGQLVYDDPTILEKQAYCNEQMKTLYPEVKRVLNPHQYYVDGTEEYVDLKKEMILSHKMNK